MQGPIFSMVEIHGFPHEILHQIFSHFDRNFFVFEERNRYHPNIRLALLSVWYSRIWVSDCTTHLTYLTGLEGNYCQLRSSKVQTIPEEAIQFIQELVLQDINLDNQGSLDSLFSKLPLGVTVNYLGGNDLLVVTLTAGRVSAKVRHLHLCRFEDFHAILRVGPYPNLESIVFRFYDKPRSNYFKRSRPGIRFPSLEKLYVESRHGDVLFDLSVFASNKVGGLYCRDIIIKNFSSLPQLKWLTIEGGQILDYQGLNVKGIKHLDVVSNRQSGQLVLECLKNPELVSANVFSVLLRTIPLNTYAPLLTKLAVVGCGLLSLNIGAMFPNLRYLDASRNHLRTVDGLDGSNLQHLDLKDNKVVFFDQYDGINTLELLNLSNNPLKRFQVNFKALGSIRLFLLKTSILELSTVEGDIQRLDVSYCVRLKQLVIGNAPQLSSVDISKRTCIFYGKTKFNIHPDDTR